MLLTTFDGTPIHKLNNNKMTEIANILSSIHQARIEEIENKVHLPKYDFIDYFFPGVMDHSDLYRHWSLLCK